MKTSPSIGKLSRPLALEKRDGEIVVLPAGCTIQVISLNANHLKDQDIMEAGRLLDRLTLEQEKNL